MVILVVGEDDVAFGAKTKNVLLLLDIYERNEGVLIGLCVNSNLVPNPKKKHCQIRASVICVLTKRSRDGITL